MIRIALAASCLAGPALANDIFVCNDETGWEITVAYNETADCIVDNVEGEVTVDGETMVCTTADPPQEFRLMPDQDFAYRGDNVTTELADDEVVHEGTCTRS
jgi:hypothetical protein